MFFFFAFNVDANNSHYRLPLAFLFLLNAIQTPKATGNRICSVWCSRGNPIPLLISSFAETALSGDQRSQSWLARSLTADDLSNKITSSPHSGKSWHKYPTGDSLGFDGVYTSNAGGGFSRQPVSHHEYMCVQGGGSGGLWVF